MKFLIQSAQEYFNYLQENQLGLEEFRLKKRVFNDLLLILEFEGKKLMGAEHLFLKLDSKEVHLSEEEGLKILSYDEERKMLAIEVLDTALQEWVKTHLQEFKLVSDLKFLIKNVETFFNSYSIALPSKMPKVLQDSQIPTERLSAEQIKSLKVVFSSALSYIWGAPGTGKTQRVLFESLMILLKEGKRVALIAPTNNALEQAFKSVLKRCDELNVSRELFLRLGMPTLEFASRYPEVCDSSAMEKKKLDLFLNAQSTKDRLETALVIGMTLDGFIMRYAGLKLDFDHIFLDECAFAPLIKALALCACDVPLTLLGDHKQLTPICEMPQAELQKYPSVKLWNFSSLYVENFFDDQEEIISRTKPELKQTKTAILRRTYRYGSNLARLLDHFIYCNGLHSDKFASEVYYLDSVSLLKTELQKPLNSQTSLRGNLEEKHISKAEILGVKKIFPHYTDCAVITPFVKQRILLAQNGIGFDNVFTIHSSQGQEFETIIFSPVTLHYHLTDSDNPLALQALNVAISRVKTRLIIVCDYGFWIRQTGQFLSEILKIAKEWKEERGLLSPF